MADVAVADARDGVRTPAREGVGAVLAPRRREGRRAAVRAPRVRGVEPLPVGLALEVPRLDTATVEGELLPQPRADGEGPGLRVRRIDRGAGRQGDPPPFCRAVCPERVLRCEGKMLRIDLEARKI